MYPSLKYASERIRIHNTDSDPNPVYTLTSFVRTFTMFLGTGLAASAAASPFSSPWSSSFFNSSSVFLFFFSFFRRFNSFVSILSVGSVSILEQEQARVGSYPRYSNYWRRGHCQSFCQRNTLAVPLHGTGSADRLDYRIPVAIVTVLKCTERSGGKRKVAVVLSQVAIGHLYSPCLASHLISASWASIGCRAHCRLWNTFAIQFIGDNMYKQLFYRNITKLLEIQEAEFIYIYMYSTAHA